MPNEFMGIPPLEGGYLPPGVHLADIEDVTYHFGANHGPRFELAHAVGTFLEDAESTGAKYALIAGSFVTNQSEPNDIDLVLVYPDKTWIPHALPEQVVGSTLIDAQFASEDEPSIIAAFVKFLGYNRDGRAVGLLRIDLAATAAASATPTVTDPETFNLIHAVYVNRLIPRKALRKGLLVTLHGIRTHADWNADVARYASSQGWVVAPFVYDWTSSRALFCPTYRKRILLKFRTWLDSLIREEGLPISIVAHSFGTHLWARYVLGFDSPPHTFGAVILTGCLLRRDLDWDGLFTGRVGRVLHERAPNDHWVQQMTWARHLTRDDLFGSAGVHGFTQKGAIVEERSGDLFDHDNVIVSDIIRGRWLPFLNANRFPPE